MRLYPVYPGDCSLIIMHQICRALLHTLSYVFFESQHALLLGLFPNEGIQKRSYLRLWFV